MKLFIRSSFVVLLLLACGASLRAEVHFKDLSFTEAKKLAAKENKKLMVDFYTDWCGWCKVLDKKTYSDQAVGELADAKFISLKVNAEKGEGIQLAKTSKVTGYPTIVFFNADGSELSRVVGYQEPGEFSHSMKLAAEGGISQVIEQVRAGTKDPSLYLAAGDYFANASNRGEAIKNYEKVIALEQNDKDHLKGEAMYARSFLLEDTSRFAAMEQAIREYPERDEARQAAFELMKHSFETGNPKDAERRVEMWAAGHPNDGEALNFFAWSASEKNVMLPEAETFASRAIDLAQDPISKASALDTKAAIEMKLGKADEAVKLEDLALVQAKAGSNKRLISLIESNRTKFAGSAGSASAGSTAH